jgi:dehydrogenase/reductase SDR family protein 12
MHMQKSVHVSTQDARLAAPSTPPLPSCTPAVATNAAPQQLSERSSTPEGFDTSFATNVLGTTALTQQLLPALQAGAPSRVVFVSSGGMYTQPLCLQDLQHTGLKPWDGSAAYGKEKRCQVVLAEHLAELWADKGGGPAGLGRRG